MGVSTKKVLHLGDAHKGGHDAVHVSAAVGQRLLLVALPVDRLQRLVQRLELERGLLLGQLQARLHNEAVVSSHQVSL